MLSHTSARVLAQYRGLWLVAPSTDQDPQLVPARGKLTETPVTGDVVALDEGGAIAAIEPRHGTIIRRAPGADDGRPCPGRQRRPGDRHRAAAGPQGAPARALRRARGLGRRAGRARADQGRPRRGGPGHRHAARAAAWASSTRSPSPPSTGEGMGILRRLLTPGTTSVLLGASGTGKSTLVNALLGEERQKTGEVRASDRPRPPHHGHPRAAHAPRRRAPDRHARHPDRRPLGRHRRVLRRRRRARAAVPLPGLRPRHRAGLRGPRRARPRADRRLAQAPARAGVGRGPPRRPARARRSGTRRSRASCGRSRMRAGEGNRTPIFGLGSQRLSHWTTPARVGSVTDADTLAACACASSGPSPSPPRRSSACSPTAWSSKHTDTTLDDAVAKGQRPAAPRRRAAVAAEDRQRARSPTTRARSSC